MSESDYDALRRALDDLAGTPPLVLGRRGAVMHRIGARQRRHLVARSVVAAVFLTAGSAGAVRVMRPEPAGDSVLHVDRTPVGSPKAKQPEPEPTRSKAPGVKPSESAKPSVKPSAEPTKQPRPEPTASKPAYQPTVKPTYAPAPAGLTAYVWVDPAEPKAGQQATVTVKVYDGAGRTLRIVLDFGDGAKQTLEPASSCADQGQKVRYTVGHVYAKAGKYYPSATVTTGGCDAASETTTASGKVYVVAAQPSSSPSPAPSYTNGPAVPQATGQQVSGDRAEYVYVTVGGSDADGWVRKVYVDWGDGSSTIAGEWGLDGCTNAAGKDHPPATSREATTKHLYASPGSYTVTVTVKSVACDGSDAQAGSKQFSVTAP